MTFISLRSDTVLCFIRNYIRVRLLRLHLFLQLVQGQWGQACQQAIQQIRWKFIYIPRNIIPCNQISPNMTCKSLCTWHECCFQIACKTKNQNSFNALPQRISSLTALRHKVKRDGASAILSRTEETSRLQIFPETKNVSIFLINLDFNSNFKR